MTTSDNFTDKVAFLPLMHKCNKNGHFISLTCDGVPCKHGKFAVVPINTVAIIAKASLKAVIKGKASTMETLLILGSGKERKES